MRLKIENIKIIKEANINLKSLTIIAGKNDTGKSTISKILFSIIHGLSNEGTMNHVEETKKQKFTIILADLYRKTEKIEYLNSFKGEDNDNILSRIDKILSLLKVEEPSDEIRKLEEELKAIKNLEPDSSSQREESFVRNLIDEFEDINFSESVEEYISLTSQKTNKNYVETNELWGSSIPTPFTNAIYIESPFIVENGGNLAHQKYLINKIKDKEKIINSEIKAEKKSIILKKMNEIINGAFNYDKKTDSLVLNRDKELIRGNDIAVGVKSIGLLKILLEKDILNKNSYLILDEPEVHLHPEWQVKLAQILVMLIKKLGINILINTHSSYFMESLDVFKDYYGVKEYSYYLTEKNEGSEKSTFKDVSDSINTIYNDLSEKSYDILDKFKSEAELRGLKNVN